MNWRNYKIFGMKSFGEPSNSKKKFYTIAAVVVIAVSVLSIALFKIIDPVDQAIEKQNVVTGGVVIKEGGNEQNVEHREQEKDNTIQEAKKIEEDKKEENQLTGKTILKRKGSNDRKEYLDYRGECMRDVKQREDDVSDLSSKYDEYVDEYNRLVEEYNARLKELDEKYKDPSERVQKKKDETESLLQTARTAFENAKASCN